MDESKNAYYIMEGRGPDMMLLYPPSDPSFDDEWVGGRRFEEPPTEPVVVEIRPGNENGDLLPLFSTATLMNNAFYEALRAAGVDNLDVYDAEIRSEDGQIVHKGYKAFNVVGLVRAADLEGTVFNDPPGSTMLDASIDTLAIDGNKVRNFMLFRLAEYLPAIVVHDKVRQAIEALGFPNVTFRDPADFIS